ncbi:hypothetical protein V7654_20525 [Bacillus sp. JJ1609]|uniref:hypothetical protein n=1 Tax=Bacillus sp. JJ1609 TaxID=3122977 RepID=UPI002FFE488F
MKRKFALSFAIFFSLVLIGCESSDETETSQIRIVESEKVWPVNFNEIAFKREESPYYSYAVRTTSNESDFEKTWEFYQLTRKSPQINFTTKEILFLSVEESGSCPLVLNSQDLKLTEQKITINLRAPNGNCTADATPRTFVIEIQKENSKERTEVLILEGNTKTTVPFNEH